MDRLGNESVGAAKAWTSSSGRSGDLGTSQTLSCENASPHGNLWDCWDKGTAGLRCSQARLGRPTGEAASAVTWR
jgi:hypothetical protein